MDLENQASQWAKSTQSRIEVFLDDYLIRSPNSKVRSSSQKLILSLFKRGNEQQRLRIMGLLESRCDLLVWMGKATENFLGLVGNIFGATTSYSQHKNRVISKIFTNMHAIHEKMISNPNYEFYSFAANLIDFGNEEFKPYLLEANGCLSCFGKNQSKPDKFSFGSCVQTTRIFTNKLEYVFKRVYDVKDFSLVLRTTNRVKGITVSYVDENKEYRKIGKFKPRDTIAVQAATIQGLFIEFDLNYVVKNKAQCVFCENSEDSNSVCNGCYKRGDVIDISGSFRVIGANEKIISGELCDDYEKIQTNVSSIKSLYKNITNNQRISLNFKLDQMLEIYQRIINNVGFLSDKNPSKLKPKESQNCFSCNYYQMLYITRFFKQILKKAEGFLLSQEQVDTFKQTLNVCLNKNKIEALKAGLLETISIFVVSVGKPSLKRELEDQNNEFVPELISKALIELKENRQNNQRVIDSELSEILQILRKRSKQLSIEQKIRIFVCYLQDWDFLSQVTTNAINYQTEVNRLSVDQFNQLKFLIDFNLSEVFRLTLDSYLKAFLKIIPAHLVPSASLEITDCEILQYVDNKLPEIRSATIEQSIICCPNPMIKLDMFVSLPTLISRLPVKQSMRVMNSLFPYRNVWNLNVIKACRNFDEKLAELGPQEQINMCLYGYCKSKEYLYIQKIYKLLVPQRLQFVIKLEAPRQEIEINNVQYPYIPIKEVKSQDLQGDTIKALHDWVYSQLLKINQAMPLDIIVQKSIIDNMDLPIELVYQNIAEHKSKRRIGDKEYDEFSVIYRVQGILGEPKQRSIGNLRDTKLEACISYASYFLNKFSDEYSKKIGLDVLIEILSEIRAGPESQDKKVILFEILSTLSMNEAICKKIVEGQYGDSIINATVRLMSFQNEKDAKITNFLLQLSSKVIDEANQEMINLRKGSVGEYRKMSGGMEPEGGKSDNENKVSYVLEKIVECQTSFEKTSNALYRDIERRLIKLLPFCSKDQVEATRLLYNFFEFSNWATKPSSKLENLFVFVDSLSQSYMTFKSIANENGVTSDIIKTITNSIRKQGKDEIDQKKISMNRSLTESGLTLLCALIQGDERLQGSLFDSKVFHNIYEISKIPPKKAQEIHAGRVPENCYKIIKYLSEGKIVDARITEFLEEKKKIDKEKTEPKKSKKWEMMKNKQKMTLSKKIDEEGDDDIIVCSSCQQGYSRKKQVLGLYIYLTKNEIPVQSSWWKDNRRMPSFGSTTFFTAIHFECHMAAVEADQKIPRSEWDGALIRNMDVLCNSWIPFKGPKTTPDEFSRVEKKYFERNKNGNFWNVVNDLSCLLEKLSNEFDFATESKGSSSSHNIRYIPILIGFACHMIDKSGSFNAIEQGINYLLENPPKKLALLNQLLCYSLFSMSYQTFTNHKPYILRCLLSAKLADTSDEKYFTEIKPHLIFVKLVEQIFALVHRNMQVSPERKVYKELDVHIAANLQSIIPGLEQLNLRYKTKYTKYASVAEFQL